MKKLYILTMFFAALFVYNFSNAQNFQWAKQIAGLSANHCYSSAFDNNGNVVITGGFIGTADFDPGPGTSNMTSTGSYDIFVVKLDASGNFIWAKQIGDTGEDMGLQLALDNAGSVYITGKFEFSVDFDPGAGTAFLVSSGQADCYFMKLDAAGNYVWTKKIGGTNADYGNDITVDNNGNTYVTGYFMYAVDLDPGMGSQVISSFGNTDIFIVKLNALGNFVWGKQLGGPTVDRGESVAVDVDGNVYTTGYFSSTADFDPGFNVYNMSDMGGSDIFISKLDSSGNFVWAKQIGGVDADRGRSIIADNNSDIYLSGNFEDAVDFDPGPGFYNMTSVGYFDIFISKMDSSGNLKWAYQMGGIMDDYGNSSTVDGSGNVYLTGSIDDSVFISKLDSAGTPVITSGLGSVGTMMTGNSIAVDNTGSMVISGTFTGTNDFDPDTSIYWMTAAGNNLDGFILKLSDAPLGIAENTFSQSEFHVYPSPSNGEIHIKADMDIEMLKITDLMGRLIYQVIPDEENITLQLPEAGVYFIQSTSGNQSDTKKIIVYK